MAVGFVNDAKIGSVAKIGRLGLRQQTSSFRRSSYPDLYYVDGDVKPYSLKHARRT